MTPTLEDYLARHYVHRSNWLRAAVLGANDGILSVASIIVGVSAAVTTRDPIVLSGLAGLVAGALSMAAGEYVSVSSQTDLELADIAREELELQSMPEEELKMLAAIYESRGVDSDTAMEVARQLTAHDALDAHIRDELGILVQTRANPLQAALASGASFIAGGLLPLLLSICLPIRIMIPMQYGFALVFLAILGALAAKAGGSPPGKAILRITVWGSLALMITTLAGYLFGSHISG